MQHGFNILSITSALGLLNVMGLFSLVPLHGGNMITGGLDLVVEALVDVVQRIGPARVKRLCLM